MKLPDGEAHAEENYSLPEPEPGLYSIWASAPDDVWAVGDEGRVARSDGEDWSLGQIPTRETLHDIWGSGTEDVWVVGGSGTIIHWNGQHWSSFNLSDMGRIWGIWGSAPNDIWAVGDYGISRWDGNGWSRSQDVLGRGFAGIWGSGPNDVWVVGSSGMIMRWNGRRWSGQQRITSLRLESVWGSSTDDVWAVGDLGIVLHWDGRVWETVESGTDERLYGIWGSGPNDVWAVGREGTIVHWDGQSWSPSSGESVEGRLESVQGVGDGDVWIASSDGYRLLHRRHEPLGEVETCDETLSPARSTHAALSATVDRPHDCLLKVERSRLEKQRQQEGWKALFDALARERGDVQDEDQELPSTDEEARDNLCLWDECEESGPWLITLTGVHDEFHVVMPIRDKGLAVVAGPIVHRGEKCNASADVDFLEPAGRWAHFVIRHEEREPIRLDYEGRPCMFDERECEGMCIAPERSTTHVFVSPRGNSLKLTATYTSAMEPSLEVQWRGKSVSIDGCGPRKVVSL